MPSLDEIAQNRQITKPFNKKEYRVWDLDGDKSTQNSIEIDKKADMYKDNIKTTNRQHKDNIKTTNRQHKDNIKTTNRQQIDNNFRQHKDNKVMNDFDQRIKIIHDLTGLQKRLFCYVLEICNEKGGLRTEALNSNDLAKQMGCSYRTVKIIIERLIKKRIIIRLKGKKSKGGFVNFSIESDIKVIGNKILYEDKIKNHGIKNLQNSLGQHKDNNFRQHKDNDSPAYSSSIYINTTTMDLPENWKKINFAPLEEIGFSPTQLSQLYETGICFPEIIQESIYYFAFDLEHNKLTEKYTDPLNVFIGVLRQGKLWRKPKDYESQQDRALRELLENKKQKAIERQQQIDELFVLHFDDWYTQQADDFLKSLLPNAMQRNFNRLKINVVSLAKDYFKKTEEWNKILKKI